MRFRSSFGLFALVCAGSASAVTVTVAPSTGVSGTAVTNTIADAVAQVNAGGDATNSIVLRSTEGPHIQPPDSILSISAGKSVDFTAQSGQPIIMLQSAGTRYMLSIGAGTDANNQTEKVTFTNIAFIPQAGLTYANNVADGLDLTAGEFVFTNCVFSANNGSNGVESQEGDLPYDGTNCVGDDWIQMNSLNDLTISHCTFTGANDDAILFGGAADPEIATCLINNGTCIANNGGAGIQIFGSNSDLVIDGEVSRVLIAQNGERANDTGIKFFWDVDCSLVMNKTDVVTHGNGGVADFEGVESMTITESRIAFNNQDALTGVANLSVWDTSDDSPTALQEISLDNVTIHDSGSVPSILGTEGGNQPRQQYTIIDSVFSGAGDSFAEMTNATNTNGASPAPVHTFSAVVTAGPHAVADVGELSGAAVSADPAYVTDTYTVGRDQQNATFLLPTGSAYLTASSNGTILRGGAPLPTSSVKDFMLY